MVKRNSFEVRIDSKRVRRSLRAVADPRFSGYREGHEAATQEAVSEVRREAPVRSGALRDSVRAGGKHKSQLVVGNTNVTYVPVTLAGRKARAPYDGDPFIARGLKNTAKDRTKAYTLAMGRALRKLGIGT